MKIDISLVTKLLISEVPNLDPITVLLEDHGQGRGKLIVECYGRSWSAYWGGMGDTLVRFLKDVNSDYVATRMFNGQVEIYDAEGMERQLRKELLTRRRRREIAQNRARGLWELIDTEDFDHPYHMDNYMMVTLVGDDWQCALPMTFNPEFVYLTRIIDAVRAAVAQTYPEKPDEK